MEYKKLMELDEIHYRYERLTSLIGLLKMIDVAGVPQNSFSDALYEIELGLEENNSRLKSLFQKKGGAE